MKRPAVLVALLATAAVLAAPAGAAGPITISNPTTGAFVRGQVRIDAVDNAAVLVSSMRFEWSSDGATWNLIADDLDPSDGFAASWETAGLSGKAIIRLTDSAGNQAHVRVTVDNEAPVLTLSAGPPAFSPNGDQLSDRAVVRFAADEAVRLTLQILGPRGLVVQYGARDLAVARRRAVRLLWDGTIYDGAKRARDGLYTVRALATDLAGNRTTETAELRVDTRAPRLAALIAAAPFGGSIGVRFSIADAEDRVQVRPRLLDQYGNVVARLPARSLAPGPASLTLTLPLSLAPGAYRVGILAADEAGNTTDPISTTAPFLSTHPVRARVWGNFAGVGRRVALTFDDCYDAGGWAGVLDVLASEHVKATFFCTGQAVLANTALGLRTVREGHAIGSHGWDHADFSRLGFDDSYARLIDDRNVWWALARVAPMPFFRPPYGAYTASTVAAAGAAGYSAVVLWEVDPYDWRLPGVAAIVSRVVGATTPGAIDLMHTLPQTAAALPTIIHQLRARGYGFMTLPELAAIGTPTPGHWAAY